MRQATEPGPRATLEIVQKALESLRDDCPLPDGYETVSRDWLIARAEADVLVLAEYVRLYGDCWPEEEEEASDPDSEDENSEDEDEWIDIGEPGAAILEAAA